MIKSIQEARVKDGIPRILAAQDWVQTISEVLGIWTVKILDFADNSQIYTAIDDAPEIILDALAVSWKIDWYDTGYNLEQKRQIVKTAMEVRRTMGTTKATRLQADAIYPGTMLEEWFDYEGEPGYFRLLVDITGSNAENPVIVYDPDTMEREMTAAKRWSAHLENLSYMVRHAIVTRAAIASWTYLLPFCGTIRCGTYWMPSTLGHSIDSKVQVSAKPEGFSVEPEFTGTLPSPSALGFSIACGQVVSGGVEAFSISPEFTGTLPEEETNGD
jgi:phage tail P2-like protein